MVYAGPISLLITPSQSGRGNVIGRSVILSFYEHLTLILTAFGIPAEYCYSVWCAKTRMVWLPESDKSLRICFDSIPACDGRTEIV